MMTMDLDYFPQLPCYTMDMEWGCIFPATTLLYDGHGMGMYISRNYLVL